MEQARQEVDEVFAPIRPCVTTVGDIKSISIAGSTELVSEILIEFLDEVIVAVSNII